MKFFFFGGLVLAGMVLEENLADVPEDLDPAVVDLCLLSSCNHSISSQGQYGQWAAFLAAGDVYSRYGPVSSSIMNKSSIQ